MVLTVEKDMEQGGMDVLRGVGVYGLMRCFVEELKEVALWGKM